MLVGMAWFDIKPPGYVVIMLVSVPGIWCLCIGGMLIAYYRAELSATVSVITANRVTVIESAIWIRDAGIGVTGGSLSAPGFRIRREFNCAAVCGIGCRLLRCMSSKGKTGGSRGKVGVAQVYSRVPFTDSRSVVTALPRGLVSQRVCSARQSIQGRRIVGIRSNLGRMVLLAKVRLVR